jgi:cytochrome c-type biogenesis protein CcmF
LLSHVGVSLLALAVIASTAGKREAAVSLRPGESATVLGHTVSFVRSEEHPGPNRTIIAARLRIGDGTGSTELTPALNVFVTSTQAIATPAIVPGLVDDLYVTLVNLDATTGVATIRVGIHPFVSWIWPAGALVALGGALAAWPLRRRSREVDLHGTEGRVVAGAGSAIDVVGD